MAKVMHALFIDRSTKKVLSVYSKLSFNEARAMQNLALELDMTCKAIGIDTSMQINIQNYL